MPWTAGLDISRSLLLHCLGIPAFVASFEPAAPVLSLSVAEALLHPLRKYDAEGPQNFTRSIAIVKPKECFPDFGFMSVPRPERVIGRWLCQDRRDDSFQTVSLL